MAEICSKRNGTGDENATMDKAAPWLCRGTEFTGMWICFFFFLPPLIRRHTHQVLVGLLKKENFVPDGSDSSFHSLYKRNRPWRCRCGAVAVLGFVSLVCAARSPGFLVKRCRLDRFKNPVRQRLVATLEHAGCCGDSGIRQGRPLVLSLSPRGASARAAVCQSCGGVLGAREGATGCRLRRARTHRSRLAPRHGF